MKLSSTRYFYIEYMYMYIYIWKNVNHFAQCMHFARQSIFPLFLPSSRESHRMHCYEHQ